MQYVPEHHSENPKPVPEVGFKSKNMTFKLTAPVCKAQLR